MDFIYNDGGRAEAGYKGSTGDCVVRAIAIAAELPYKTVYDELAAEIGRRISRAANKKRKAVASPRNGVPDLIYKKYLLQLGFTWTPTMFIGSGCKVHLVADELPMGRIICSVSKHLCAVIDGVLHDTYDCTRAGKRCVYGYWKKDS